MEYCGKGGHLPDSIKKYLTSFVNFCEFLLVDDIEANVDHDTILQIKLLMHNWKSNYNKRSRARYWERQEEDYGMLVTPDQVSHYLKGSSSELAIKLFEIFEINSRSVTQTEYCSMHDHLLVLIHFSNGHRSGVSANMTENEFLQCKRIDGLYQIRVRNHKNFHVSGPAVVSLQPKAFNWLQIYFSKICP